jgi:hypothetical protein
MKKKKSNFGGFQSPQVREKRKGKIKLKKNWSHSFILVFIM